MIPRLLIRNTFRLSPRARISNPRFRCRLYGSSQSVAQKVEESNVDQVLEDRDPQNQNNLPIPKSLPSLSNRQEHARIDTFQSLVNSGIPKALVNDTLKLNSDEIHGENSQSIDETTATQSNSDIAKNESPELEDQQTVDEHLNRIRPKLPDGLIQPVLSPAEVEDIIQNLVKGFTSEQLRNYYNRQEHILHWCPWEYTSHKDSIEFPLTIETREQLAKIIVHGLWEVAMPNDPVIGHALYPMKPFDMELLRSNNMERLTKIARDWTVSLHQQGSALLASGPFRRVYLAISDVKSVITNTPSSVISLESFTQEIPQQFLAYVSARTDTSVNLFHPDGSLPGGIHMYGTEESNIKAARDLIIDFVYSRSRSQQFILNQVREDQFVLQNVAPHTHDTSETFARARHPISAYGTAEATECVNVSPDRILRDMRASMSQHNSLFLDQLDSSYTHGLNDKTNIVYQSTLTSGQILYHRTNTPESKYNESQFLVTLEDLKTDGIFVPCIKNLIRLSSKLNQKYSSSAQITTKIKIKLTPNLHNQSKLSSNYPAICLPPLYLHFEGRKSELGFFDDLKFKQVSIALHEKHYHIMLPTGEHDLGLVNSFLTDLDIDKIGSSDGELHAAIEYLLEALKSPASRFNFQQPNNFILKLQRNMLVDMPDMWQNVSKNGSPFAHVEYSVGFPQVSEDLSFNYKAQDVIISTIEGNKQGPTRTEAYIRSSVSVPKNFLNQKEEFAETLSQMISDDAKKLMTLTSLHTGKKLKPQQQQGDSTGKKRIESKKNTKSFGKYEAREDPSESRKVRRARIHGKVAKNINRDQLLALQANPGKASMEKINRMYLEKSGEPKVHKTHGGEKHPKKAKDSASRSVQKKKKTIG